ncbi:MAG TPA: thioredoxin family protein [Longimicrobium sp.]|nr:thioredoxin family protein [Longimicrobium sp.]
MAVSSTMLELGTRAPDFALADTDGRTVSRDDFADAPALLVMFLSNHCPFVKHLRGALAQLARDYAPRGVAIVGIMSNDVARFPADAPERMAEERAAAGWTFPYLYDATQEVARAYRAACTPDLYLFDGERRLVYRGQFDDSRPNNGLAPTGADVRAALDAVLAGRPVSSEQRPSIGCNIKWMPGNEPEWFG